MTSSGEAPRRSPAHIRWIGRVAAVTALVIAAFALWMVWAGMPAPLATAMADAEWEPCIPKYAAAATTRDSARVDTWVLKPRSRFTPAVTCGSLRRERTNERTSEPTSNRSPERGG
jgi:hypothetical protein